MRFLAISGSLRAASSNTALLRAAGLVAPSHIEIVDYNGLGDLPHFNPDLENDELLAVHHLRAAVRRADGLLISCPEYAHGVPGSLKNALDWLVGGAEFINKPVALFNASPRSFHAQASLKEIVKTMSGHLVEEASITVALLGKDLDAEGIAGHPEMAGVIRNALIAFADAIERYDAEFFA